MMTPLWLLETTRGVGYLLTVGVGRHQGWKPATLRDCGALLNLPSDRVNRVIVGLVTVMILHACLICGGFSGGCSPRMSQTSPECVKPRTRLPGTGYTTSISPLQVDSRQACWLDMVLWPSIPWQSAVPLEVLRSLSVAEFVRLWFSATGREITYSYIWPSCEPRGVEFTRT